MAVQKTLAPRRAGAKKGQKAERKFVLDASKPVEQKIFDISAFEKFLTERIKVENRTGNLGNSIKVSSNAKTGKVEIVSQIDFSGRYLKYLTKKYLKQQQLRDWLRVVSTNNGTYEIRYFNVAADDEDEENDEDDE